MYLKRAISILLSSIFIFTNIPCVYARPQSLASRSQFKLWKEKGIDPQIGLIIEARERAILKSILQGNYAAKTLQAIDAGVVQAFTKNPDKFLQQYPFDYKLILLEDNITFGILVKIYKDRYGKQQLILFYDPDNPPWKLLERYGARTPEDKEFAKRGWWISSIETPVDPSRRALLALIAIGIPTALILPACVFDTSGLPELRDGGTKPDSGIIPDGGEQPTDTIERPIDASLDIGNNPITILQNSSFSSEDTTQHLSSSTQFVRSSNAAFRYNGSAWHWILSESDRTSILNNGLTYIFNGRNHKVKLIGQGNDGRTKTIVFNPQIPGIPNYTQAYRITITAEFIQQLAQEIGMDLNSINIHFENLEPTEELVLNGFQKQYAVIAASGEVTPDAISPAWNTFNIGGASINAVPTPEGINIGFNMTAGDNSQSAGVNISTKSGGIDLFDPDLQGAWKMNEADVGIDNGPNGNTLTNIGGVGSVPGRFGSGAEFNGSSYLEILDTEHIGLDPIGNMTITCWIKLNSLTGYTPIISKYDVNSPGTGRSYELAINPTGTVNWIVSSNGTDASGGAVGPSSILLDQWYHIAAVRDGGFLRVYVNGGEMTGLNWPEGFPFPASIYDSPTPFRIGNTYNSPAYLDGVIDEAAIYDRALTPEEIQNIYNQVDSSNFLSPSLSTVEFNTRGNSPFMLRLTDNSGQTLNVFVLGLDPTNWRNIIISILQAREIMNPLFDLNNVASVRILLQDTILPVPIGTSFNGTIEIKGLIGMPPITRHRYATDEHDIDITGEDYDYLIRNLERAETGLLETRNGISVIGITEWHDILPQDGLGFTVNGRIYSAFTARGGTIYIPHPDILKSRLKIKDSYIRDKILKSIERRTSIILGHEIDEINNPDHREAVFNEFSKNSINGLNYADIVTVLLETLSSGNITTIDEDFHRQFISNLLMQGMFLDREGNAYLRIIREIVDDRIDESTLRAIYLDILTGISKLVSSNRFIHRRLSKKETTIADTELEKEPGFRELHATISESTTSGTIYIDLAKFLVKNNSLATKDEVVTIDFEYLKRFLAFVRKLQGTNVKLKGVYDQSRQRTEIIEQLTSIIREDFGLSNEQFPIQAVDFSKYLEFIGGPENAKDTVSILSSDSWQAIPNRSQFKIVDSFMDRYNRVNSSGWEFYTALKGLSYDTPQDFLQFIIDEALQQLIKQKAITENEASELKEEILKKGIALIPTYYDPIHYYKTIESQKALLIAA